MTADEEATLPQVRPIVLSSWLVVIGALILYGLTLNHWVTLRSLPMVAQVTGWDWHPLPLPWREEPMAPLFLAVSAPVRLLPTAWEPLALNVLTALCAVATLFLLAESVRLMPQDRTPIQRLREIGANGLLSIRATFLPALFAVLMLAGQLTFWQNAVAAMGEMLNLPIFAFVIYCLLRFRISQNDKWLLASVFAYGIGDANDWAFLGFLPWYLVVLLRIRRAPTAASHLAPTLANIFALLWHEGVKNRFFWRLILCALAGHLLYLLVPLVGLWSGGGGFSYLFLHQFGLQRYGLLHLVPHWVVLLASACALLPLLFATICWPSYEGDFSAVGNSLNRFAVHALHLAFLALALAVFFEFKNSPGAPMRQQPVSFLTFYYMAALAVGYYSGYVLLVFGSNQTQPWLRPRPAQKLVNFALVSLIWVLAAAGPALLAGQNLPRMRAAQSGALDQFASQTLARLPDGPAIVLSDDPLRLYLLEAACVRHGARGKDILIDTDSFSHRDYIYYLAARHPELRRAVTTNLAQLPPVLPSETLVPFMALIMQKSANYYLHPSFGCYCEALYLKPRGLAYELRPFTTSRTQPPLESEPDIASNQAYWSKLENGPLNPLPALAKLDPDAVAASAGYSAAINDWATELQKAHHLKEAHDQFAQAVRLNTNNFIARINLDYNERLQAGDHRPVDSTEALSRALFFYRGLLPMLEHNGPADEPGLDLKFGEMMAQGGQPLQAVRLINRRLELLPDDPEGELALANIYCSLRQPSKALALVRQLHNSTNVSAWDLARCEAAACMAARNFSNAEIVLRDAVRQDPNDENRVAALGEFYRVLALDELRRHQDGEAARHFAIALTNINLQLQLLASPTRTAVATFDVPQSLLKKAEVETMLQSHAAAVATLSQLLQDQPDNYVALLDRAGAERRLKQFQAARDDYNRLRGLLPSEPYIIDLGLAGLAAAETNRAEEIAELKRCIKSAPADSGAYHIAAQRLARLQGQ